MPGGEDVGNRGQGRFRLQVVKQRAYVRQHRKVSLGIGKAIRILYRSVNICGTTLLSAQWQATYGCDIKL